MVIKVQNNVDELLQFLRAKYFSENDLWEALSIRHGILYGEITKQFRAGKPINKTLLKKVTQIP